MRIGLAYDLRDDYRAMGFSEEAIAEFDSPATIEAIEASLARLGHEVDRIGHIFRLAERLVAGDRWDLVFNVCEGLDGRSREAQVPALLEAYGVACTFSDPLVCALTLDKAMAKRIVRDHGLPTAPFVVVETAADIDRIDLPLPLFAKPVAEGTGKGCGPASRIETRGELRAVVPALLDRYRQPVIVEPYLPGREVTVGIVGTGVDAEVVGVVEIELLPGAENGVYSLDNKERCEELVRYVLIEDDLAGRAAEVALACYRALECRDGGRVDLRCDGDGNPLFLEVNPLAGLHPSHSDLPICATLAGKDYDWLIGRIVASAAKRVGRRPDAYRRPA